MANQIECGRCGTLLHKSLDMEDAFVLKAQLQESHHLLHGDGYALNVIRTGGICPICELRLEFDGQDTTSASGSGVPPSEPRKTLTCPRILTEREASFVQRHSTVHLNQDASLNPRVVSSAEYALVHSALRHFVLGPGSSVLGHLIGLIGLLEPGRPCPAISHLCHAVELCTKKNVDSLAIAVSALEIRGGSCVVIQFSEPRNAGEAYMVALATGSRVDELDKVNIADIKEYPQFFTLERTRVSGNRPSPAMLCQWRSRNRDDYYNNARKNYGWGSLPVVSDFVDCVERIMVSGIWDD
jgi:hypothetical protein